MINTSQAIKIISFNVVLIYQISLAMWLVLTWLTRLVHLDYLMIYINFFVVILWCHPARQGTKNLKPSTKSVTMKTLLTVARAEKIKKKKRHEHVSKMSISTTIRNQIKKMKKWLWVFLKIKRLPVNWSSKQAARSIINDTICICFWGYRKPKKVWWVQRNERLSGLGVVFGQLSTELELKLESEPVGIESKANKFPGANMRLNKAHPPDK